jgi:hypothetical protein
VGYGNQRKDKNTILTLTKQMLFAAFMALTIIANAQTGQKMASWTGS